MPITGNVKVLGDKIVLAKLAAARSRALIQNRLMVTEMLGFVKAQLVAETPIGPGHFGYHLRDSYVIEVTSSGDRTLGKLMAPRQGYWREFGTKGRSQTVLKLEKAYQGLLQGYSGGGEKAGMYAHKALRDIRRFINFYYGKGQIWRS